MKARDDYPLFGALRDAYIDGHDDTIGREASRVLRELDDLRTALVDAFQAPWPVVDALGNRDLLDELAGDDDLPVFRRNQCRQAVDAFDLALSFACGGADCEHDGQEVVHRPSCARWEP